MRLPPPDKIPFGLFSAPQPHGLPTAAAQSNLSSRFVVKPSSSKLLALAPVSSPFFCSPIRGESAASLGLPYVGKDFTLTDPIF